MSDFLLELMSEEMPASLIETSAIDIGNLLLNSFQKNNLAFKKTEYFFSTKRLTYVFYDIRPKESIVVIDGPSLKAPIKAAEGFAKSHNTTVDKLKTKKTKKGDYYFIERKVLESDIQKTLVKILESNLSKVPWKKSMRWGHNSLRWIRPLKNILCIYDKKLLKFNLKELVSNDYILNSDPLINKKITIKSIDEYFAELKNINVIIKQEEREKIILEQAEKIALRYKLQLHVDQNLLKEVTNLVEYPCLFLAKFDKNFLKLPSEVLITSMKKNQKYFPLYDNENKLSNFFIIISNIDPHDKGKQIIYGNQCVIEARLDDASFFWDKDNNSDFKNKTEELRRIIFHNKLGTIQQKVERMKIITNFFIKNLNMDSKNSKDLLDAVSLCKNDLPAELVREFPSLQGTMGYYYSQKQGFNTSVSKAIRDHYKPYGPLDKCPETKISKILAIIDKIDSLVGFFLIGLEPSSSKDPYALRRAGLGIIRIISESQLSFNLTSLIGKSVDQYVKLKSIIIKNTDEDKKKILNFILERIENLIKVNNIDKAIIFKSMILDKDNINLINIDRNCENLYRFTKTKEGENFLIAFKRILNILESSEEKIKTMGKVYLKKSLLQSNYEKELYNLIIENFKYNETDLYYNLSKLVLFTKPINTFFEEVQINDKNILLKVNRLCLLSDIKNCLMQVANFSKIIKGKEL
ncbi:MAG: glycine--tRNA ligase subunit beta [Rickettsiales bacterium]|nr:glycine--tRNA ligase subunit beta [Rickettsiales bacterium]OUV82490.1 MAG: glycine--tRNA ligase subunit beta [Rickettsiales bacterium TMED131]|tara:strand:- start:117 stop:2195 length:2079 start_codon:yes stop_codon:yes gene_type:complete